MYVFLCIFTNFYIHVLSSMHIKNLGLYQPEFITTTAIHIFKQMKITYTCISDKSFIFLADLSQISLQRTVILC